MELRTRKEIREYINAQIKKPETLEKVFNKMKRRRVFYFLKFESFYYHVKKLQLENKIHSEESRDFHPKRKPVILICKKDFQTT